MNLTAYGRQLFKQYEKKHPVNYVYSYGIVFWSDHDQEWRVKVIVDGQEQERTIVLDETTDFNDGDMLAFKMNPKDYYAHFSSVEEAKAENKIINIDILD